MESYDKIVFQFPFIGSAARHFSNNGWMRLFYMVGLTEAIADTGWQERK
jgi:hypothetical protein